MVSPVIPRLSRKRVPDSVETPSVVLEFLKEMVVDPFVADVLPAAVQDTSRLAGNVFGATILAFSSLAAGIGALLPGALRVEAPTLSEAVARRNNLTTRGAHALMLRGDVNSRGINGILARRIIDIDMRGHTRFDLDDVIRVLPRGVYRTKWLKVRRTLNRALKVPAILRRKRGKSN